jgi:hypothetical protein
MDRRPESDLDGLPRLAAGSHWGPRSGACFMEYASFLAGERWSDEPKCTDPSLALLARAVNDECGDDERQRLLPLVPTVVGVVDGSPVLAPALVLLSLEHANAAGARRRTWERHRRAAERRMRWSQSGPGGARWCRITDAVYRGGPASRVFGQVVAELANTREGLLEQLLADAITTARRCCRPAPVGDRVVRAGAPDSNLVGS